MFRPTKQSRRRELEPYEQPLESTAASPLSPPTNDEQYKWLNFLYKESQKEVETWILRVNHWEGKHDLSFWPKLAKMALDKHIDMPSNIKKKLDTVIKARKLCRDWRRAKGDWDTNHDCPIQFFEEFKAIFLQPLRSGLKQYHRDLAGSWRINRSLSAPPPATPATPQSPPIADLKPRPKSLNNLRTERYLDIQALNNLRTERYLDMMTSTNWRRTE